jgi:hypothetical protein
MAPVHSPPLEAVPATDNDQLMPRVVEQERIVYRAFLSGTRSPNPALWERALILLCCNRGDLRLK